MASSSSVNKNKSSSSANPAGGGSSEKNGKSDKNKSTEKAQNQSTPGSNNKDQVQKSRQEAQKNLEKSGFKDEGQAKKFIDTYEGNKKNRDELQTKEMELKSQEKAAKDDASRQKLDVESDALDAEGDKQKAWLDENSEKYGYAKDAFDGLSRVKDLEKTLGISSPSNLGKPNQPISATDNLLASPNESEESGRITSATQLMGGKNAPADDELSSSPTPANANESTKPTEGSTNNASALGPMPNADGTVPVLGSDGTVTYKSGATASGTPEGSTAESGNQAHAASGDEQGHVDHFDFKQQPENNVESKPAGWGNALSTDGKPVTFESIYGKDSQPTTTSVATDSSSLSKEPAPTAKESQSPTVETQTEGDKILAGIASVFSKDGQIKVVDAQTIVNEMNAKDEEAKSAQTKALENAKQHPDFDALVAKNAAENKANRYDEALGEFRWDKRGVKLTEADLKSGKISQAAWDNGLTSNPQHTYATADIPFADPEKRAQYEIAKPPEPEPNQFMKDVAKTFAPLVSFLGLGVPE